MQQTSIFLDFQENYPDISRETSKTRGFRGVEKFPLIKR